MTRPFTAVLVTIIGAASAYAVAQPRTPAAARPNILLVISDDIGVDVMSSLYPGLIDGLETTYGASGRRHPQAGLIEGRPASTPNLDRLAQQGIAFTDVWAQPFCSPTRASILTGLWASTAGVLTYADPLAQGHPSLVQALKDNGYSTGLFGKWHLAGLPGKPTNYPGTKPKEAGFELFRGNMHAAIRTYWDYDYQVQEASTPANAWRDERPPQRSLPGIAPTTYAPVVKVADALAWIEEREKADPARPWLAWVAFNLSHATAQQKPSAMAVPNLDTLDAASAAEMKACGGQFGTSNVGQCSDRALMRAMTNSLDTLVGKLLAGVEALDPNTYVVFVGDNGTPMYGRPNLDFIDNMYITRTNRGKGTVYESGVRVPLLIKGPGIRAASRSTEPVHVADLFPTILSFAGITAPTQAPKPGGGTLTIAGVSLAPILSGKATSVRDPNQGYLLTENVNLMKNNMRQVGARNGTYKVICTERVDTNACEFYNLAADPLEEYPLEKPASCGPSRDATWTPEDPRWHYCRLMNLIDSESFL